MQADHRGVAFGLLGLDVEGSAVAVVALAVANAVLGMSLGLLVSAFATTEFQAVQFMPAFVLPQMLLCGLFVPREQMSAALEAASYAMPLTPPSAPSTGSPPTARWGRRAAWTWRWCSASRCWRSRWERPPCAAARLEAFA